MDPEKLSALVKIIVTIEKPDDENLLAKLATHPDAAELLERAQPSPSIKFLMAAHRITLPPKNPKEDFVSLLNIIIKFLVINNQNKELRILLKYIQEKNIKAGEKSIIELNNNKLEFTPLLLAAAQNSAKCLAVLLQFGANINALAGYNDTYNKGNAVTLAAENGSLECLSMLLDKGMHPDSTDAQNRTALWLACSKDRYECAELLLKKGANPNICDNFEGWSPLHWAQYNQSQKLHDLLFKYNASFKPLQSSKRTTVFVNGKPAVASVPAASDNEIKEALLAQRLGLAAPWEDESRERRDGKSTKDEKKHSQVKLTDGSNLDKELSSGVFAEQTFFNIARQRKKKTHQLRKQLQDNRKSAAPKPVDVTGVSARQLITADAAGIKASIQEAGGEDKLTTRTGIDKNLPWAKKTDTDGRTSYNVQVLNHSGTRIAYKHTPTPGHLGGFYMYDTAEGKGNYDDIIQLINSITGKDPKKEAILARCMLNYAKTGQLASKEELAKNGINPTDSQYNCFKRVCLLTSVKEVVRRLVPGLQSSKRPTTLFPFALTHYRALDLISHGHLSMQEVFSADAPYGLATGKGITSTEEGLKKAHEKIKRVNRLYNENILLKTHPEAQDIILNNPFGFISGRAEEMHQELRKACGGASDTDGITYLSDKEAADEGVPRSEDKQHHSSSGSSFGSSSGGSGSQDFDKTETKTGPGGKKKPREESAGDAKEPSTKSLRTSSSESKEEFAEDAREEKQDGWNCFDVAVGLDRSALVAFALQHADSKEYRQLLTPEIRNAAAITAILMNLKDSDEETDILNAIQISELFALLETANQFGEAEDQQHLSAQIEEIFLTETKSDRPNLSQFALPKTMQTQEVQLLVNNYNNAHERMRAAVAQCNTSLGYGEKQRKSLAQLDTFFGNQTNRNQHRTAYERFAKARAELFTPHEQAFFDYCSRPETYRTYVSEYYGQKQWFAFQPSSTNHLQTSMIDIAAQFLEAQIVVHQKKGRERKIIYQTASHPKKIHVQFNGYGHFVALIPTQNTVAQQVSSFGFMPSPRQPLAASSSSTQQGASDEDTIMSQAKEVKPSGLFM